MRKLKQASAPAELWDSNPIDNRENRNDRIEGGDSYDQQRYY